MVNPAVCRLQGNRKRSFLSFLPQKSFLPEQCRELCCMLRQKSICHFTLEAGRDRKLPAVFLSRCSTERYSAVVPTDRRAFPAYKTQIKSDSFAHVEKLAVFSFSTCLCELCAGSIIICKYTRACSLSCRREKETVSLQKLSFI